MGKKDVSKKKIKKDQKKKKKKTKTHNHPTKKIQYHNGKIGKREKNKQHRSGCRISNYFRIGTGGGDQYPQQTNKIREERRNKEKRVSPACLGVG